VNADLVAGLSCFYLGFLNFLERIARLRLGLQIADDLRRGNQSSSDIGKKLIGFLAFKMFGKVF
jgi:hypothetical protein